MSIERLTEEELTQWEDTLPVINRLIAEVRELRAERRDLAAWMMRVGQRWPDHACGECVPNGPLVDPRFQCAWHRACAIERGEHER